MHSLVMYGSDPARQVELVADTVGDKYIRRTYNANTGTTAAKNGYQDEIALMRFLGEAKLGPSVIEVSPTYQGGIVVLLEYWPETLSQRLQATRGNLPAADWATIHAAVQQLHALGIIHGDLHPGNVVFGPQGEVGFIDLETSIFIEAMPEGRWWHLLHRYGLNDDADLATVLAHEQFRQL